MSAGITDSSHKALHCRIEAQVETSPLFSVVYRCCDERESIEILSAREYVGYGIIAIGALATIAPDVMAFRWTICGVLDRLVKQQ